MTSRQWMLALLSAALLLTGFGGASAVECSVCERRFADCRAPAQAKFVSCMNDEKSNCSLKCTNDCKDNREAQRCTLDCVRSCQSASTCRVTFANVTSTCSNDYRTCRKDCTVPGAGATRRQ